MVQNTSHAVMAQRSEPNDSLDDFPTPPCWATRALCEHVIPPLTGVTLPVIKTWHAWEPACNRGHMANPLCEYFCTVLASDVHDYGYCGAVADFLFRGSEIQLLKEIQPRDWIITNPPFRLAEQFVQRGLEIATRGVAMLTRSVFIESAGRYRSLFSKTPPAAMAQFVERVIMAKGVLRDPSKPYWDENAKKWRRPSTATSYSWLVWLKSQPAQPRLMWIPPCRAKLERREDYP